LIRPFLCGVAPNVGENGEKKQHKKQKTKTKNKTKQNKNLISVVGGEHVGRLSS